MMCRPVEVRGGEEWVKAEFGHSDAATSRLVVLAETGETFEA
jgi:hypothetical protein